MCEVIRVRGRTIIARGKTASNSGFSSDAAQNRVALARQAPTSHEVNESSCSGIQGSNGCGLSHRHAKYRQTVGGLRVS